MKPYYEDESVTLYHGDWRKLIPADFRADLILTDPPYGETSLEWDRWPDGWPSLAARHADSMWCFGSMRMFLDRRYEFADWRLSQDVVWEKNTTGMNAGDRFSRCHEFALHWYRGEWSGIRHDPPRVMAAKRVAGDVISRNAGTTTVTGELGAHRVVSDGTAIMRTVMRHDSVRDNINSTQKPVPLLEPLIQYACPPGGLVLDFHAGSCATLVAARNLGRRAVGYEVRESQCEEAAKRLAQGVLDFGDAS